MNKKSLSPVLPYLAVWAGLFLFKNAWAALLGFHLALLIVAAWLRPALPLRTLFKSSSPKRVVLGVLLCSASGAVLYGFWDSFGITPHLAQDLAALGLNAAAWPWFIAYFVLVNPLLEEYYWRAVLADTRCGLSPVDFLFAGYHVLILLSRVRIPGILFAQAMLIGAGWFWRQTARDDNGLLAPVLGHMAADLTILLAVRAMTL